MLRLRWKLKSGSIWYSKYYEIWKLPSSHFSLQIIFSLACNLIVVSKIAWMVKYPIYIWEYSLLNNVCMMYLLLPSSIWLIYLQYSLYPHIVNSHLKIRLLMRKRKDVCQGLFSDNSCIAPWKIIKSGFVILMVQ